MKPNRLGGFTLEDEEEHRVAVVALRLEHAGALADTIDTLNLMELGPKSSITLLGSLCMLASTRVLASTPHADAEKAATMIEGFGYP